MRFRKRWLMPSTLEASRQKGNAHLCRPVSKGFLQTRHSCALSPNFQSRYRITRSSGIADAATLQTARMESCLTGVLTSLRQNPKRLFLPGTKRWLTGEQSKRFAEFYY